MRDPLKRDVHIRRPISVWTHRNWLDELRTDTQAIDDKKTSEWTVAPVLTEEENEGSPRVEECVAARNHNCDGAGEIFQLRHEASRAAGCRSPQAISVWMESGSGGPVAFRDALRDNSFLRKRGRTGFDSLFEA